MTGNFIMGHLAKGRNIHMPILFTTKVAEDKELVSSTYYSSEELSVEDKSKGIVVEVVPPAENRIGKQSDLYYRPSTGELFYEYTDRPLAPQEKLIKLEEKQDLMQQAIDDLIFGGAF